MSANHRYVHMSSPTYSTFTSHVYDLVSSSATYRRRTSWSFDLTETLLSIIPREHEDPKLLSVDNLETL